MFYTVLLVAYTLHKLYYTILTIVFEWRGETLSAEPITRPPLVSPSLTSTNVKYLVHNLYFILLILIIQVTLWSTISLPHSLQPMLSALYTLYTLYFWYLSYFILNTFDTYHTSYFMVYHNSPSLTSTNMSSTLYTLYNTTRYFQDIFHTSYFWYLFILFHT